MNSTSQSASHYVRPILFAVAVVVMVLLTWQIKEVFLLLFGSVIFATVLRSVSDRVQRHGGVPRQWAVAATVFVLLVIAAVVAWLLGDQLAAQFDELWKRLPAATEAARKWLDDQTSGRQFDRVWNDALDYGIPFERIGGAAGTTIGALGNAGLMVILGIYLTADPALYRKGLVRLIPVDYRPRVESALAAAGEGLGSWLVGQAVSMVFVGIATAIGLALLGSPIALSLGVIAGIFAFIPFFGPIASGLLAVALAFIEGPDTALYVAVLCVAIQQIEGNLLMPFVQRWAVALPPVLGVIAVVVFGLLFGFMGVILATPLMVVVMILVRKLYVDEVLESGSAQRCFQRDRGSTGEGVVEAR